MLLAEPGQKKTKINKMTGNKTQLLLRENLVEGQLYFCVCIRVAGPGVTVLET